MQRSIRRLVLILLLGPLSGLAQAQVLAVDQLSGAAALERGGARLPLGVNDPVIETDTLRAAPNGRLSLRFANAGFFELGPGAELVIERLPYATFAPDLRTVLRLKRGFLRVVWNHAAAAGHWPLLVHFGAQRASLDPGEYFFEASTPTPVNSTACVAHGAIEITQEGRGNLSLQPSRCYFLENRAPQSSEYSENDWVNVRSLATIKPPQPQGTVAVRKPDVEIRNVPAEPVLNAPVVVAATPAQSAAPPPKAVSSAPPAVAVNLPPAAAKIVSTTWALQLVSASTAAEAEREVKRLQAAGYGPAVETAEVNGRTWHRVRIAGFASAADARKTAEEIKAKLGYANAWVAKIK